MINKDLQKLMDKQLEKRGHVLFSNAFPFHDITNSELSEIFLYLAKKNITSIIISRKIKWKVTKIPSEIGEIKSLIKIIINSSKIIEVPNSIGDLHNLETLNLSRTNITKLPSTISKLINLKNLNLSFLKIKTLPDLRMLNNLEILMINDSTIKSIPDYLSRLKNFRQINVRNIALDSFPMSIVDSGIKILTNDVANLGLTNIDGNSYKVFIQIRDEIKIIVKEYLSYFNQYVKRAKKEIIKFSLDETEDGLILNFVVDNEGDLEEIKSNLSEFISFTEKTDKEIVPFIHSDTSDFDKGMLMLELTQRVRHFQSMLEGAKDNLKVLSMTCNMPYNELDYVSANVMITGFSKLTESTPISNIYLEQSQSQNQSQKQEQIQELQNYLEPIAGELDNIISNIADEALKNEGNQLLSEVYPLITKPTEEKIENSGLLPKLKFFMTKVKDTTELIDTAKDTYNNFAENYNGLAKIFKYSALALL